MVCSFLPFGDKQVCEPFCLCVASLRWVVVLSRSRNSSLADQVTIGLAHGDWSRLDVMYAEESGSSAHMGFKSGRYKLVMQ
jgi:hypothetical protein